MKTLAILSIAAACALTGCASIVNGSTQSVTINSTPSEAGVLIRDTKGNQVFTGQTPASVTLQKGDGYFKKREYVVEINKPGFDKQTINLTASVSGWYIAGNLLFGGVIGYLVVDPITGSMWTLSTDAINANLQTTKVSDGGMQLNVALVQDLSATQRSQLVALK